MELKTVVTYEGARAYYRISPENNGIYQARLIKYEGAPDRTPPREVLLVRGIRHWSGSSDQQVLLDQIGKAIEERARHSSNPSEASGGRK